MELKAILNAVLFQKDYRNDAVKIVSLRSPFALLFNDDFSAILSLNRSCSADRTNLDAPVLASPQSSHSQTTFFERYSCVNPASGRFGHSRKPISVLRSRPLNQTLIL
jgi:hypothetical protein